jgi:hypothetical protein
MLPRIAEMEVAASALVHHRPVTARRIQRLEAGAAAHGALEGRHFIINRHGVLQARKEESQSCHAPR